MPQRKHADDYGWDVCANSIQTQTPLNGCITYGTGIHIAPDPSFKGCVQAFARSSVVNTGLILSNGVGIIDRNYRGEIMAKFYVITDGKTYDIGDKIIQLAASNGEDIEWEQVATLDELGHTDRGTGGYGSTGR